MKRIIPLAVICLFYFSASAQNNGKAITLDEVSVKAAKVINKVDGQLIFPTEAQKNTSNNGYSILQKLSLPNLRIDNATHSINAIDNRGSVQIRINGIIVGKDEMLALDPKLISKIDFIDNPGLRYGNDIAYIINIITKRNDRGYTIGADMTSAITSLQGDGTIYGKWNSGKSEISASYDFNGHRLKGQEEKETAEYLLNDGSTHTISRNDVETLRKSLEHDARLTYNYADSTTYVLQVSVSGNIEKVPEDYSIREITDGSSRYSANQNSSFNSSSPVLDLYVFRQPTPCQSITANAVGTYISTTNQYYYDEGAPYQYDVNGKTASALSEIVYENRMKPFTLSAGLNHRYKYTRNDYMGDASALTEMNQHNLYGFSEIKGTLQDLRYSLGIGTSYIHYNQNEHSYDFWTFRPKATLSYDFLHGINISYTFEMKDRASRIAMINEATIQTNSMEKTVGNPSLKPARDLDQTLRLSYNNQRWSTYINGLFRHCNKPNMALYERTSDDKFIYTQINQKEIDLLHLSAYASYWIMPEKLQASAYGGMQRCFNYGNEYSHFYTSWFFTGDIIAYLGDFMLRAYFDNGSRFLEGEKRGYNGAYAALQTSYQYKNWQFSLTWANPFVGNYKQSEDEILNRNLHKNTCSYNKDSGNLLSLNVSWRLSQGKQHKAASKTINLKDTDNGILK